MNLKQAVGVAKQQLTELFAEETLHNVRLEQFLYDDHLGVWTLTIGYAFPDHGQDARSYKIVRVSEADKSVLSIEDC
jgi:hypothetical protein